jgi:hypothetical protein
MMDAVEFLEQLKKRSKSNPDYYGEELNIAHIEPISLVSKVEQWAKEHPVKTRQSVFLEQFPNAPIYTNTHNVALDPCLVDTTLRGHCPTGRGCDICRREFWLAEVEE